MSRSFRLFVFGAAVFVGLLGSQHFALAQDSPLVLPIAMETATAAPCEAGQETCSSCEPVFQNCCNPCRHLVVGAEAVWLSRRQTQTLGAFEISDGSTLYSSYDANAASCDGLAVSPRIMAGLQGECWGIGARYWRMREPDAVGVFDLTTATGFMSESIFKAETVDLEVTRLFCVRDTQFQAAFGVRYAQLEQSSYLNAFDDVGGNRFSGMALSSHEFHGTGLTGGLTALRPIGCRNFNLFCNLRGSIVWDPSATNLAVTRACFENVGAESMHAAGVESSANLFIGEVQIGGQWDIPLKCIPANAFVRGALEYQYWATNNTGGAEAFSAAGISGGVLGASYAQSTNQKVDLVGFNVGAGITW